MYKEIFGTAMGSPVSVTAANLVMEEIEKKALSTFDIKLPFWKGCVDEACIVVPADRKEDLLSHLNQIENSINFTVEEEHEGCLAFLDVLIKHQENGDISTSVYHKNTHTDKYLDFSSHHPLLHKKANIAYQSLHSYIRQKFGERRDRSSDQIFAI